MTRTGIIQRIVGIRAVQSYLEIGVHKGETFDNVLVRRKVGVDPVMGGTHRMTSDEYFRTSTERFDLIFIDGLHRYDQVLRDFSNARDRLTKKGVIVLHDCLPQTVTQQLSAPFVKDAPWCGDVWKAAMRIRTFPEIDTAVFDCDYGCAVCLPRPNFNRLVDLPPLSTIDWMYFINHWRDLNVLPHQRLEEFLGHWMPPGGHGSDTSDSGQHLESPE